MATTNTKILCQNIGVLWAKCVAYWEDWVTDNTKTIAFSLTTGLNCKVVRFQYTIGADVWQFDLHTLDIFSSATYVPIAYVMPLPAWRTMPKVLLTPQGTTVVKTSFEDVLVALRADIFATWLGCPGMSYTITSHGWGITGLTEHTYKCDVSVVAMNGVDVLALSVKTAAVTHTILNDLQPTDGLLAAPQVFLSGGGGGGGITAADGTRIADSLESIEMNRLEVSINHGATVVTAGSGSVLDV